MSEMLAMGDYGAYVWGSFGLTFAVLAVCIIQGRRRHAQVLADVETRIRAMESES